MNVRQDALEESVMQNYLQQIEKNRVQIWDLEEENRVLNERYIAMKNEIAEKDERIQELEDWCEHLQDSLDGERKYNPFNFIYRVLRKIKRAIFR